MTDRDIADTRDDLLSLNIDQIITERSKARIAADAARKALARAEMIIAVSSDILAECNTIDDVRRMRERVSA